MESYKNLKKGTKVGLIVSAALCVIALVGEIINLVNLNNPKPLAITFISLRIVIVIGTIVYTLVGYKKSHGNMLRTILSLFAGFLGIVALTTYNDVNGFFSMVAAINISYVAGRLNRIGGNRNLLFLVGLFLTCGQVVEIINANNHTAVTVINILLPLIIFTALAFSYTARFEAHKAAELGGIRADRIYILAFSIAGGLAGMAGLTEINGIQHMLLRDFNPYDRADDFSQELQCARHARRPVQ